ncbi:hypothetical protein V6N11_024651 [Hibiscus sabdariffa]|uniref:Uncharacterized protein n=1 Tax=Hibiscus sabdariffa TaxID=183260 RepID=A0ABR2QN76_9ROSI
MMVLKRREEDSETQTPTGRRRWSGEKSRNIKGNVMMGTVQEQNLEKKLPKQKGCIGGFFHIFDLHHIRLQTIKRLPSTASREATPEQEKNVE